ncbi:MAG: transporter substrate-binding protein [Actinomycetia bacterium]|nr:transporter substrate-binding protein [Actinomycetes bacterium]
MKRITVLAIAMAVVVAACGSSHTSSTSKASKDTTVVLMTHDSFAVSKPVLAAFERASGIKVKVLKAGDAGAELNQAILTKDHPLADVMFGVDNTFLGRALDNNIFEPYRAGGIDRVSRAFVLDSQHRVTPVDYGDICLNYDKTWFGHDGRPPAPTSAGDLVNPAYKGLTVVENPASSSPGLGFLLATIATYGDGGWQTYWANLRKNGVLVDDGWDQAYDGDFTVSGGKRPIVVSYASSPPADVVFSSPHRGVPRVGVVYTSCFRQVEFVGVLRGAKHPNAAQRLVDFMISEPFQRDVPLEMYVYPVRRDTPLPPVFTKFGALAPHPAVIAPSEIGKHRDEWIKTWTNTVLH